MIIIKSKEIIKPKKQGTYVFEKTFRSQINMNVSYYLLRL